MQLNRHRVGMMAFAVALGIGGTAAYVAAQPSEQVIKVTAKKFDYTPSEITLKKGVPVVLEFTTLDVVMGFKVADLDVRTDIIPGQVSHVHLVPDKVGSFPFTCDIFCGAGHEDMTGTITVVD